MHVRHVGVCSFVTWSAEGLCSIEIEGKTVNKGSYVNNIITEKSSELMNSARSCHKMLKIKEMVSCFPFDYTTCKFM